MRQDAPVVQLLGPHVPPLRASRPQRLRFLGEEQKFALLFQACEKIKHHVRVLLTFANLQVKVLGFF